jgi:hypothetical protein
MAKQKRRKAGKKNGDKLPGWVHMSAGLAIGLAVAYGIYVSDRRQPPLPEAAAPEPVAATANVAADPVEEVLPEVDADAITFDFYDMLPNLDVDLYENAAARETVLPAPAPVMQDSVSDPEPVIAPQPAPVRAESRRVPVEVALPEAQRPGIYILQAGSFSALEVAQKRRVEMQELGVPATIKRGSVNGKTVYRVYTDPMDNPRDVNRVRTLLTGVGIDILQKRVSD